MLAEISYLIGGEDLEFNLTQFCWRNCFSLKEARFACIIQIEFL
jgi:hypothetical protein